MAVFLELRDDMIRDSVPLVLRQGLLEAAHDLARAPQCEGSTACRDAKRPPCQIEGPGRGRSLLTPRSGCSMWVCEATSIPWL